VANVRADHLKSNEQMVDKVIQRDLWGSRLIRCENYLVFHDESEPKPNKGWLLIGLLFVRKQDEAKVLQTLRYWREKEGYWGEIHFCDLPKSFNGAFGGKARVAKHWLKSYQSGLFETAMFSCLAVDRSSPRFEHWRFSQDYHAYNRFTAMAIKAAVAWFLVPKQYEEVRLTLMSDGKDRKSRPDQGLVDNFEHYVAEKVEFENWIAREIKGKDYPRVIMDSVQTPSSDQHDLLQLTDALLGAFQCALVGNATRHTKRELARIVASWIEDLRLPPWQQKYKMHRKFNVWGFPDLDGKSFNHFKLAISGQPENQLRLFDL